MKQMELGMWESGRGKGEKEEGNEEGKEEST